MMVYPEEPSIWAIPRLPALYDDDGDYGGKLSSNCDWVKVFLLGHFHFIESFWCSKEIARVIELIELFRGARDDDWFAPEKIKPCPSPRPTHSQRVNYDRSDDGAPPNSEIMIDQKTSTKKKHHIFLSSPFSWSILEPKDTASMNLLREIEGISLMRP